jgi:hypothetical protein
MLTDVVKEGVGRHIPGFALRACLDLAFVATADELYAE